MIELAIANRNAEATVIVFSGMAPLNHVFEWTTSFSDFPANIVGVKDPHDCWYQRAHDEVLRWMRIIVPDLGGRWLACVGGSAGGFAALWLGRLLGANRILAFCPQSACGEAKRALGDWRWRDMCNETPSADIAGDYPEAIVHYALDEPWDVMHARRLGGVQRREWPAGGHRLPYVLKEAGSLRGALEEAMP